MSGQSVRLRLSETYTAPQSDRMEGDEFVFERSLGRCPAGVMLDPDVRWQQAA